MAETPKLDPSKKNWREIVIITDGNYINLKKAEVSGQIELCAILRSLAARLESEQVPPAPEDEKDGAPKPAGAVTPAPTTPVDKK